MRTHIAKALIACVVLFFAQQSQAQTHAISLEGTTNTEFYVSASNDASSVPSLSLSINMDRVLKDLAPTFSLSLTNPSTVASMNLNQSQIRLVDAKIVRVDNPNALVNLRAIELGAATCEPVFSGTIEAYQSLEPGESIFQTLVFQSQSKKVQQLIAWHC